MTDSLRLAVRDRQVWLLLEVLAITIWAVYLTWDVLDFDPYLVPAGVDYVDDLQGNFAWERVGECGLCALWNGDINGGAPAFADSMSPLLHPLVIVTTLAWGAINGSKAVIVLAMIVGGLGQLWIGYELGAGRAARRV
jgi:hypothetical protein